MSPYPRRPDAQPCQYYLKTGKCNYGQRCKFDHPARDKRLLTALSRRDCFDYVQSARCPYGARCKYNHPPLDSLELLRAPPPPQSLPQRTAPPPHHSPPFPERADDPIARLGDGARVFEWRTSPATTPIGNARPKPPPRGFDPLAYDAQLFGSWTMRSTASLSRRTVSDG